MSALFVKDVSCVNLILAVSIAISFSFLTMFVLETITQHFSH